jgi:hypothetical protein
MLKIIETSENVKTLSNVLEVLLWMVKEYTDKKEYRRDKLIPIVVGFMNTKPKLRLPVKNVFLIILELL